MNPTVIPKAVLLVVAIITMIVGLFSHYHADWSGIDRDGIKLTGDGAPYHLCDTWPKKSDCRTVNVPVCSVFPAPGCAGFITVDTCIKCPHIGMERYFVAMIIICVIGTIISLVLGFVGGKDNAAIKFIDVGLNVVLALMLLVASILYIVSTVQIHNLFAHLEILRRLLEQGGFEIRELRGAKIAAAVIGIVQSILHVVVAALNFRK